MLDPLFEMNEPPIELVLPPELDRFNNFQAVRIRDDYLKYRTGLYRDCLAVFVVGEAEVRNGELAVISIRSEEAVSVGFVSCDMSMVALEKPFYDQGYLEAQVFNEDEVEILGKIVGFCEPTAVRRGRYVVKPIDIKPEIDDDELPPLKFFSL